MGVHTAIEWADSTLNLQMGCLGCELWDRAAKVRTCYAGNLVQRHAGQPGWPAQFERPEIYPKRMDQGARWVSLTGRTRPDKPWLDGLPRVIFLNDLGDTFSEGLPEDWLAEFLHPLGKLDAIVLVLTKRVQRAQEFFDCYPAPVNFRLGVSVTDVTTARARLPILSATQVPGRFISAEPWLGPGAIPASLLQGIEWVILGGESGQSSPGGGPRPSNLDDLRGSIDAAHQANAAVFVKQLGTIPMGPDEDLLQIVGMRSKKGNDWNEWPADLRVREMPASFGGVAPLARALGIE